MAEKEPLVGSPQPPYRSITPGRIRLGDGVPERTATKPKPQPQPEPEPEYEANPRTPGVPSSPGLASFGSLVSDVQSGYSEVIITSRLGWTQQKDQHSMHLAARQAQQVERHLAAGEKVQWSVSIEAYDIMVHARFLQRKNSGDTVTLVFREKRLGDPYSQDEGAMISGVFVAEVAGTLQISLDNSHNNDAKKVSYSFSNEEYDFALNRRGILSIATPGAQDDEPFERLDLTEAEVHEAGETDLNVVLPPRREDEGPRLEGNQLLHFGEKKLRQKWEMLLKRVLKVLKEERMKIVVVMQKWARVGLAKRAFGTMRRNALIHDRKRSANRAQKGSVDEGWEKPYAQLKLKTRPLLMTFSNRTLRTMQLVDTFVEKGGVWWQEPPAKIAPGDEAAWGSFAKRMVSENSGCLLYRGPAVDYVLAWSRTVASEDWTGGALYPVNGSPPLQDVYKELERNRGGSPRASEDRPANTDSFDSVVLEWGDDPEQPAAWILCSEKEHEEMVLARAAAKEEGEGPGASVNEIVEELIQVQFFHSLKRSWDGGNYRMVPAMNVPQLQIPAWWGGASEERKQKGGKLGHWKSTPEQIHALADKRLLPVEGAWQWADEPWQVDKSLSTEEEGWQYTRGTPHVPGHPANRMPEVPGTGWSPQESFGALVRRRVWQRARRKVKRRMRKNTDLANPFFTTTAAPRFVARITTTAGEVLSIWRPVVPGSKMILGDCVMEGEQPPEKMVAVDPLKIAHARSAIQREWVQRVVSFKSVWDNGKVYLWRPVVPVVAARILQRKKLHPLGWIFTTTPAQPDIENVAVIHQDYLDNMSVDDIDSLPFWDTDGFHFEAAAYADRTVADAGGDHAVNFKIVGEELGMDLRPVETQDGRRLSIFMIEAGSEASRCAGLEVGMVMHSIAGTLAATLDLDGIERLLHNRPLRLSFEAPKETTTLRDALDADGDGKLSVKDVGAGVSAGLKGGMKFLKRAGGGVMSAGGGALSMVGGDKIMSAVGLGGDSESDDGKAVDENASEATFFLERKNKMLYASFNGATHEDYPHVPSFWALKKDIQPEEETDDLARSSRYTPHLRTLQDANQANGDEYVCSSMLTKKHTARSGLEMITGSGDSFRVWDLGKGECTRELDFAGSRLSCVASAGNTVFSGSGDVLTGTDVSVGKRIPGAAFIHSGAVTCADCVELPQKDASGRPTLAVVSGSDEHDRSVRLWISDDANDGSGGSGSVDLPQIFRRVAMPGIGMHRGRVLSCQIWPLGKEKIHDHGAFRYFRLAVMRTDRQRREVKVKSADDQTSTEIPAIRLNSFRLLTRPDGDTKNPPQVVVPTTAVNLSLNKPVPLDVGESDEGVDWVLPATDPEPDRPNSFLRCSVGVLELFFEEPVHVHSYAWDLVEDESNRTERPEKWQLYGSDDWVSWKCLDDCSNLAGSEVRPGNVMRTVASSEDAAVCLAPFAPPDLRHVPMVVSTGDEAVRVWSLCADHETPAKTRRAKGVCLSVMRGHTDLVNCCAVTADGLVVSGSNDNTVRIWQPHGGVCLEILTAPAPVLCVATYRMSSSVHLYGERVLLRKTDQPNRATQYTIRQITDPLAIPGGKLLLSGGAEEVEPGSCPTPNCGEGGEDTFEAYAWRLEPAGPGHGAAVHISCERNGATWYLGTDGQLGNVVLDSALALDREDRCPWFLEFEQNSEARPAAPKNAIGRGRAGEALLNFRSFYKVIRPTTVVDEPGDTEGCELQPGQIIQIVNPPVRPIGNQDYLWQEVVVVEGDHSGGIGVSGNRVGGWLLVAHKTTSLIDSLLTPIPAMSGLARLRCGRRTGGKPSYLMIDNVRKSVTPAVDALLSDAEAEPEMSLVLDTVGNVFRFEQAVPQTTIVAGCADGTVQIWSDTTSNGRWVDTPTSQPVKHAGAIQQVHLVPSAADESSTSEGMLLLTCSKEVGAPGDQTVGVWRIDGDTWQCVCRLQPLVVPDYIAGMVKYIDPGLTNSFTMTYADPWTTSLTAMDLLRIRGDYESLFEKIVKSLKLQPAPGDIADRSRSRILDPDMSFCRERKDDVDFKDGDCYYWIQSSASASGHAPTFVTDQPLSFEDCKEGLVVREKDTPSDKVGGLFRIESVEHVDDPDPTCWEKIFSPRKTAMRMAAKAKAALLDDDDGAEATLAIRRLEDDDKGMRRPSLVTDDDRDPREFIQAGFWEGYSPRPGPDWLLFFVTIMPYDWSVWFRERDISIWRLLGLVLSWPAELWAYRKRIKAQLIGEDEGESFADTEEDSDWQKLLEKAKQGTPVEAMVVPIPGSAGMYSGAQKEWDKLIKYEIDENPKELSLLHVCCSYCDEHEEEQNSLLALEVPEVVIQFKWYKFGQKKIMEEFRFYLWLVIAFSIFTIRRIETPHDMGHYVLDPESPNSGHVMPVVDHVLAVVVFLLTLKFMWGEVTSVRVGGWPDYIGDFWNWMDWSCYILLLTVIKQTYVAPNFDESFAKGHLVCDTWPLADGILFALPQLLQWAKVLFFLRAFEETGVFTMMIVRIMVQIKYFVVIMFVMILGFTFPFYVMFNESDRLRVNVDKRAYDNIMMSAISTYNMGVLGDFNMDAFYHQDQETWMLALFFILTAMLNIVLLNLLIALMGSIYEEEQENSANHRRAERASMILEIESQMSDDERRNPDFFPEHLHVLREKLDDKHTVEARKRGRSVGQLPGKSRNRGGDDERSAASRKAAVASQRQTRAGEESEHTEARLDAIMGMLEGMHDAAQAPPPTPKKEPTNRP